MVAEEVIRDETGGGMEGKPGHRGSNRPCRNNEISFLFQWGTTEEFYAGSWLLKENITIEVCHIRNVKVH